MTYTIKGKKWTEFDINERCADLYLPCDYIINENDKSIDLIGVQTWLGAHGEPDERTIKYGNYNPCNNPSDTDAIIDKCWEELIEVVDCMGHEITNDDIGWCKWSYLMAQHNCTKLVAACICYIEINEAAL
jgi:hypothetical protein